MKDTTMKGAIPFLLILISSGCSKVYDTEGTVYSGKANLNFRIHEFTATNADSGKDIILTMTGPHELTFSFNNKISHIDYEKDVIIFRSEADQSEWTAKKARGGFELDDGTFLKYGNCRGWSICLLDETTEIPILKGEFSLKGNNVELTLWISDSEKHVELLGLMANGLFNRSRNINQMNESLETVSPQVWTF